MIAVPTSEAQDRDDIAAVIGGADRGIEVLDEAVASLSEYV